MSRVSKKPIQIPEAVKVSRVGREISIQGPKGALLHILHESVEVLHEDETLLCQVGSTQTSRENLSKFAGTTRAILQNMVLGVVQGFEKRLQLVGVGYRAAHEGNRLVLSLGFSHPCFYVIPTGIEASCPSPTEIRVSGLDKQKVGQAAADIRSFKPPEPYKGKGIRYHDEVIMTKEAKKK